MTRRAPWLVYAAVLLVLTGVMAWTTARLLGLERERVAAEQRSAHAEQVRLVLWRLDSEVAPLLSQEIAAITALAQAPDAVDRIPRPQEIRARFVLQRDHELQMLASADRLTSAQMTAVLDIEQTWAKAPPVASDRDDAHVRIDNPLLAPDRLASVRSFSGSGSFFGADQQSYRDASELFNRVEAVDLNVASYQSSLATAPTTEDRDDAPPPRPIRGGPARPTWIGSQLLLLRQVELGGQAQLHCSWIDWTALQARLHAEIVPLLPDARLVPTTEDASDDAQHLLATLPVRLDPGPPPALELDAWSALGPSLLLGWLGTLAAALAVFAVLRWSLALSERRAAFVSAVTHELRTPLTTFRMYAEMLEEGMVDEAKRSRYVSTLRREADRLGELVENVLTYARIESDRAPLAPETLGVGDLLARMRDRLEERCRAAGLTLDVDLDPALAPARVRVDPTAAEQILFNLVDNAAKYAPSRDTPRIELRVAEASRGRLALTVRDHGPGIAPAERAAIFEPFAKARAHEAGTKPGVGLGLALCRRLARQLGGDLRVEAAEPGARFVLTVPRASGEPAAMNGPSTGESVPSPGI
ncbi:MAG: HAMP domain-containing histidine kinase [Myxococcales bacterium]|nr:HAMP domain-containing histidine kinase [Myxococcales bacterium]